MLRELKQIASRHLINIPGWRTNRKIVVFESDDWGSIRMSSRKVLNELINKGYSFEKCTYGSNDALETNTDLEYLLETLSSVKDSQGNPAIFTINNIVANPDFKRIKEDNFNNYYYESFVQSLKKKQDRNKVMELYKEGVQNRIFKPQFHGREHVHTDHWMEALRNGNEELREIFQRDMFTYPKGSNSSCKNEYLDSMATYGEIQHSKIEAKIKEGLDLFEKIWGFRSKTIIAPCYIWSRDIEHIFRKYGIQLIQSGRCQKEPIYNQENYEIIRRFTGQRNKYGQVYSIRNVTFEPSSNPDIDWVSKSLKEIATAFLWKKPAIISTHRVNFIGSINKKNRERNLNFLEKLLDEIISNWPEVEFMSSDDLADIILRRD